MNVIQRRKTGSTAGEDSSSPFYDTYSLTAGGATPALDLRLSMHSSRAVFFVPASISYNHRVAEDKSGDADRPGLDDLITLKDAAALCELSYSHLRRLARTGEIWAKKFGTTWLTTEQAVNEYLARDRRPGPKPKGESRTDD